jgi:hypothetical protein
MGSNGPAVGRGKILLVEDDPDITLAVHTVPGGAQDHLNGHQFDPVADAMYREGHHVREAYRTAMGTLSRGGAGGSMAPHDRRPEDVTTDRVGLDYSIWPGLGSLVGWDHR